MPRVSRNPLEPGIQKEVNKTFINLLASFDSKLSLKKFLLEFLTREEKLMLAKRLALYVALDKGYDYREINRTLRFSFETIRKAKETMEIKSQEFKANINNLTKIEEPNKTNKLFKFIELALVAKGDLRARAKLLSGDY